MTLKELLNSLTPTGPAGFEGLVRSLLEAFLQQRFYLARAGSQRGRDASSVGSGVATALECKRYGDDRPFSDRELLGELLQAADDLPDLDLWILASTREIPESLVVQMTAAAARLGVEFRAIGWSNAGFSRLEALCATAPDVVLGYCGHLSEGKRDGVRQELTGITAHREFDSIVAQLRGDLSRDALGYVAWRDKQNAWLVARFNSETESRAAFGTPIDVASGRQRFIERRTALEALDGWLVRWGSARRQLVVAGEEGDGKTWAVASWLQEHGLTSRSFSTRILPLLRQPRNHASVLRVLRTGQMDRNPAVGVKEAKAKTAPTLPFSADEMKRKHADLLQLIGARSVTSHFAGRHWRQVSCVRKAGHVASEHLHDSIPRQCVAGGGFNDPQVQRHARRIPRPGVLRNVRVRPASLRDGGCDR